MSVVLESSAQPSLGCQTGIVNKKQLVTFGESDELHLVCENVIDSMKILDITLGTSENMNKVWGMKVVVLISQFLITCHQP